MTIRSGFAGVVTAVAISALPFTEASAQTAGSINAGQAYCTSSIQPYLNSVFLAYIKSSQDAATEAGLTQLAAQLAAKTSLEESVKDKKIRTVGLDIENDDLCFFPFIYWPVTSDSQPLSAQAQWKVQTYLGHGGFIMFDILDAGLEWRESLKNLLGNVNLGTLEAMADDHTLRNTFYKNSTLPGSINLGPVYVQNPFRTGGDNVSRVMVGDRNWPSAWAGLTLTPNTPEHEQAWRGGVNIVLYAFTGDYKGDNATKTLEQLGR